VSVDTGPAYLDLGGRRRARPVPGSGAPMSLVRPLCGRAGRIADRPDERDGIRVLVGRIWPRGMTTSRTLIEEQCKTVARRPPSAPGITAARGASRSSAAATAVARHFRRILRQQKGRSADVKRCSLLTSGDVTATSRCRLSANRHSWTGGSATAGARPVGHRGVRRLRTHARRGPGDAAPVADGRAPAGQRQRGRGEVGRSHPCRSADGPGILGLGGQTPTKRHWCPSRDATAVRSRPRMSGTSPASLARP
jgi:uncharacterized protein YeaO (DUF488 family)